MKATYLFNCSRCRLEFKVTRLNKITSNGAIAWVNAMSQSGTAKTCVSCRKEKLRQYRAKTRNASTRKYEKTMPGFLMRTYRNMLSRVSGVQKMKNHLYLGLSILPRQEFYTLAKNSSVFIKLFNKYTRSGFDRRLCPTPNRILSHIGYIPENIEWVTHSKNSSLGALSKSREINRNKRGCNNDGK